MDELVALDEIGEGKSGGAHVSDDCEVEGRCVHRRQRSNFSTIPMRISFESSW
jgi:hypothetical protein